MKKVFTLLTLLLCVVSSAWADDAILSWNMGADGVAATGANSITGAAGCAAEGFTIAITGNTGKSWSNGNGDISYGGTNYKTLKNSNGAQNTITCPAGKVATQIVFYVTANADDDAKLSELDGTSIDEAVTSHKNYSNPTVITKSINNKTAFTFTFSTKQVCFIAVVTYTDAASDVVANPIINQTGTNVTMTCSTSGAKIYYTTDGTEPTVNSNLYSSAITLDNSCSVRAKAFNGDKNQYSSDAVKKDCYIDHSSEEGFVAVLGYDGGTVSGDVWTSTDAFFVLTNNVEGRGINYAGLSSGQDGFKLNHTDSYTLSAPDVKITKIVVVGKSWLQGNEGNASTIAFDGFTPTSGTFYDYPTNGETYVNTVEFTPESELSYGATIIMRPGNNQLGAWIEIYGVKRSGPADPTPVAGEAVTWDFSSETAQTAALNGSAFTASASNTLYATDGTSTIIYEAGSGDDMTNSGSTYYLKGNGMTSATNKRYFVLQIAKSGTLSLTSVTNNGKYTITKAASADGYGQSAAVTTITTTADGVAVEGNITYDAENPFIFIGFPDGKIYTQKISWAEVSEDIELTTTASMQGWRSFYADGDYTLDANTKAYVVTKVEQDLSDPTYVAYEAVLKEISDVPAGMAVLLKTTNQEITTPDGHYSMTLTKAESVSTSLNTENLLKASAAATNTAVYRLGSKDGKVGFFEYNVDTAQPNVVVLDWNSNVTNGARELYIRFADDETTGISNVNDNVNLNKVVFDLQGRRVAQPGKGLYIVNGKKVVIK